MTESAKRARFTKVASARTNKILYYIGLLENCSNRSNYEYDAKDVDLMFSEIDKAVRSAKAAFASELEFKARKGPFSFKK